MREFSSLIDADVMDVLSLTGSVSARNHLGGTAPAQVRVAIENMKKELNLS